MRITLGLLLVIAAGLKLYGLNVAVLPRADWFATPQVQLAVAAWELVLGFWLLSGAAQYTAWLAAIGTFFGFAIVSAYFGWIGAASCGCFGAIDASPWAAFAVDVAAILVLALLRPRARSASTGDGSTRAGLIAIGVLIVIAGGTLGLSRISGIPVEHASGVVKCANPNWDFGTLRQVRPETLTHSFRLENRSETPITITKISPDCSCVVLDAPPTEIRGRGSVDLNIAVTAGGRPGPFQKRVQVVLGTSPPSELTLGIQGLIAPTGQLYCTPEKLDFGHVQIGDTASRSILVARFDESAVEPTGFTTASSHLRVSHSEPGDRSGSFVRVTVELHSLNLAVGPFTSKLVVHTDHRDWDSLEIPVSASITSRATDFVSSLFIDRLGPGETKERSLTQNRLSKHKVRSVAYEGEGPIHVHLAPSASSDVIVRITRSDSSTELRIYRGSLVVTFDDSNTPLRIPFAAFLTGS